MVRGGGGGVGKPLKHKIRLDMKNLGPAPPLIKALVLNVLESACVRFVGQSEWIDMEGVGERDDDKPPNARR